MKTIKTISILLLVLLLSGCATVFQKDALMVDSFEKDARTAVTYYKDGKYVTYYFYNGTLLKTEIVHCNIWKIQKGVKK